MTVSSQSPPSLIEKSRAVPGNIWQEIALANLLLMQLSWVVPWHGLFNGAMNGGTSLKAYLVFGSISVTTLLVTRYMRLSDTQPTAARPALLALLIGGILFAVKMLVTGVQPVEKPAEIARLAPDEFAVAAAVILVWRFGHLLGREYVGLNFVNRLLRRGVLILFFYAVVASSYNANWQGGDMALFLFSAFTALGTMRVVTQRELRGAAPLHHGKYWLAAVIFGIGAVVLFANGVGSLMDGPVGLLLVQLVKIVVMVVVAISMFPPLAVYMLMRNQIERILMIFREYLAGNNGAAVEIQTEGMDAVREFLEQPGAEMLDLTQLFSAIKPVLLWGLAVVAVLFVLRKAGRFRQRVIYFRDGQMDYEDVGFKEALLAALAEQAGLLRERFRSARWRYVDRVRAEARIRYIYASLLDRCVDLKISRREAQTPLEFLTFLEKTYPDLQEELTTITQAFVQVRYGELESTGEQVMAVETAWGRVAAELI